MWFDESEDDFTSRMVRLMDYAQADSNMEVYYCFTEYPKERIGQLASLKGVEVMWEGWYVNDSLRTIHPTDDTGRVGVFRLDKYLLSDFALMRDVLFRYPPGRSYIVATGEQDFSEKIRQPLIARYHGELDTEELRHRFLFGDKSILIEYDQFDVDEGMVNSDFITNTDELAEVADGPI